MGLEIGSDLTRIERQQAFLDAAAHEVFDQNLITNSPELYSVVKAVLAAINTSPDLGSPSALAGLAFSLRSINMDDITFTFLPVFDSSVKGRVEWKPEAAEIWQRIINDDRVPGTPAALADEKAAQATKDAPSTPAGDAPSSDAGTTTDDATDAPATTDAPSSPETTDAPAQEPTKEPTKPTKRPGVC